MRKRKWILLFCLTLLPGCGGQLLQKPVADPAFAQQTDADSPTTEQSVLILSDPPALPATKAPAALIPTKIPATPTPTKTPDTPTPTEIPDTPTPTTTPVPPDISADSLDTSGLSNKKLSWYFMKNSDHQPTRGAAELDISEYDGHYLGDTSQKCIYLTFDEGYENGYTATILDTLKDKGVHAAFFCVGTYIRDSPDLVKRMAAEGHVVADHTENHPSLPDKSDQGVLDEIYGAANRYKDLTGLDMARFLRPPSGEYSERIMYIAKEAGFKTIFWSFAYEDWLLDQQPGKDYAYKIVMDNLHNGEILLLHAVSSSDTEALPDIIDSIKAQGYVFKSLYDLPDTATAG